MKRAQGSCWLLLSILAVAKSQVLPACPAGIINRTIANSAQAVNLTETLLCSGGHFEVTWVGDVSLTRAIAVSDGTSLEISGSSSGRSIVDGGAENQLFNVSNGSTLGLQGLSLVNGASSLGGGAVGLSGSSSLEIVDCWFNGNTADNYGGKLPCALVAFKLCPAALLLFARQKQIIQKRESKTNKPQTLLLGQRKYTVADTGFYGSEKLREKFKFFCKF